MRFAGVALGSQDARYRVATSVASVRVYAGPMTDNRRWEHVELRPDDIVISTPSKSGTTWLQHIIVRLVQGRTALDRPIGEISPWLDALTQPIEEVRALLDAQEHRRVIKTHTPLDGLPRPEGVSFVVMVRHPLDVALSMRDHIANIDRTTARATVEAATGPMTTRDEAPPETMVDYLAWWIDNSIAPDGAGPIGLEDFCNSVRVYWEARHDPAVGRFHYNDMLVDTPNEIAGLARFLGIEVAAADIAAIAEATSIGRLRADAQNSAPFGEIGFWNDPRAFFRVGGDRGWAESVPHDVLARFQQRFDALAGDAASWVLRGRAGPK